METARAIGDIDEQFAGAARAASLERLRDTKAVDLIYTHFYGLADLGVFGYVMVTLLWLHTTMMCVTLYFHRDQAHRSVDLHASVRHFCRFWLWMNTGASTR